jgi:orotidine-5'-phosphate decarboxylase
MPKNRKIIVALDSDSREKALSIVRKLLSLASIYKVGSELFTACGPSIIKDIKSLGVDVFLDLKFHDIPNTVAKAARVAAKEKVFMFNVHASGGADMLKACVAAVKPKAKSGRGKKPIILGVTTLTSLRKKDLGDIGVKKTVKKQVLDLAALCKRCGLDGVVCSAKEIRMIKDSLGEDFITVTPGIRPKWAARHDQKRVETPKNAFKKGADYIVIGRTVTESGDPAKVLQKILGEI